VTVWLAAPTDSTGLALPDLVGLPLREALRRLTLRQVQARIAGRGVVVRQTPAAGTPSLPGSECHLWCEPGTVPATLPAPGPAAARPVTAVRTGP
jgi:beta-lactam-binding protein with PASTA domain